MALRQGEAGAPIEEICRKMGLSVGMQWELRRAVGAQWELRRALARTDQWVRHRSGARKARLDLLQIPFVDPRDGSSGDFSNQHRQQPLQTARWVGPRHAPHFATVRTRRFARRRPISSCL